MPEDIVDIWRSSSRIGKSGGFELENADPFSFQSEG